MVLIEAFAAGTPAIASPSPATATSSPMASTASSSRPATRSALAEELQRAPTSPSGWRRWARRHGRAPSATPGPASPTRSPRSTSARSSRARARRGARARRALGRNPPGRRRPAGARRGGSPRSIPRPRRRPGRKRRVARRIGLAVAGAFSGIGLTALAAQKIGVDKVVESIVRSDLTWVLVACALMALSLFFRAGLLVRDRARRSARPAGAPPRRHLGDDDRRPDVGDPAGAPRRAGACDVARPPRRADAGDLPGAARDPGLADRCSTSSPSPCWAGSSSPAPISSTPAPRSSSSSASCRWRCSSWSCSRRPLMRRNGNGRLRPHRRHLHRRCCRSGRG